MKKRILSIALCVLFACSVFPALSACGNRSEVLKVYNWEDYIDPEIIPEFENWYLEETGKKIKVEYSTFDTNESMYTKVARSKIDYDVICPSEYMTDKMKNKKLLKPLDTELIGEYIDLADIDPQTYTESDRETVYSLGYMWGTVGLLYNTDYFTQEDVESWGVLWDNSRKELYRKMYMKDSIRESMSVAATYAYKDELMSLYNPADPSDTRQKDRLLEIINDYSTPMQSKCEALLKQQKPFLKGYEVDNGKDELVTESAYLCTAWSGDAIWSMADNEKLAYYVPHEGGNIWSDGWAIPAYSKNYEAANMFIAYMSMTDNAYTCMDYIGYTSAILSTQEEYRADVEADEDGFFEGKTEDYKQMYLNTYFPSPEIIARCAIYKDFGDKTNEVIQMWARVMIS